MTTLDPSTPMPPRPASAGASLPASPAATGAAARGKERDLRLDFFRGIAMFIILVAHTPGNFLTLWIPARFGFSDATEMFVFCSGMASALAFGAAYRYRGWLMGTARVVYRCWQVYWAHIGLFMFTTALVIFLTDLALTERNYVSQLNLWPFLRDTERVSTYENVLALMTLRYVPNYFDILPMYLVVLAMMPLVMAAARISPWLVAAFCVSVWLLAQFDLADLPAEPWSDRKWFFNPFGWQLLFFTGFAFAMGWLPRPPTTFWLVALCLFVVLISIPVTHFRIFREVEMLRDLRETIAVFREKSDFGILRYLHFLALAYLCYAAAGDKGRRLVAKGTHILARAWQTLFKWILKVGQQSLAVFVFSMALARFNGFLMDYFGRDTGTVWAVNIFGWGLLIVCAYTAGWFKSAPWRKEHKAA